MNHPTIPWPSFFMRLSAAVWLFALVLRPAAVPAHVIVLKDGQRIQTGRVWEENGFVKYRIPGGSLGIRKERVEKIVYEDVGAPPPPPKTAPNVADLQAQLREEVNPANPVEAATLATVTIVSPVSKASGFFISGDGHILTNKHVVQVDRDRLNEMEATIDAGKKQLARLERQLSDFKKKLDADAQWLSRTKQELGAMQTKRRFPSKRLAKRHMAQLAALNDNYNARLYGYYARHDQYDLMLKGFNDRAKRLNEAMQTYEAMDDRATSRRRPYVVLIDGTELDVDIVRESDRYDVALLKLDRYRTPFLVPGNPDQTAIAKPVFAIGNPTGQRPNSVSAGTLKNIIAPGILSRREGVFLQSDAKIYPGNSGGPLIDEKGRVLGINTMKEVTRKFEGLGYALSIRTALAEFEDILPN
jgi:S1-C subfamily serine protease